MDQAVFSPSGVAGTHSATVTPFDSRDVFAVLCAGSVAVLCLAAAGFAVRKKVRGRYQRLGDETDGYAKAHADGLGLVQRNGGPLALAWGFLRAAATAALVAISAVELESSHCRTPILELSAYAYTLVLSLLSIAFPGLPVVRPVLALLLLSSVIIYAIRDAGPLWSYTHHAIDPWNSLLLVRAVLLVVAAILPPLCTPQTYLPTGPDDVPTEEETASVLSKLLFTYRDRTVWKASRVDSLELEDLPPLMRHEEAEYLKTRFMKWVDPKSPVAKRGVVLGMLRIWWWDLTLAQVALSCFSLFSFAGMLGTNRLLSSLENPEDAVVRPWVWIIVLGAGPTISGQSVNLWQYFSSRPTRQAEALLLQLFFDHSLRLRLHETATDKDEKDADMRKKKASIVGRISSLMSSDIGTIMNLRMLPYVCGDPIFSALVSGTSLYLLLGWSAFVAIGLSLLILPAQAYIATLQWKIQRGFSSTTDERVDKVTETLGGLRTIKMLGLESQVKAELNGMRDKELKLIRKSRLIQIYSGVLEGLLPTIVSISTLAVYSLVQKRALNASTIFTAVSLLEKFGWASSNATNISGFLVGPLVALKRINDFLRKSPLIEEADKAMVAESWTGFRGGASFTWYDELPEDSVLHNFRFSTEKDLIFPAGKISIVTGPTSSGKTSLLMALLGEMHFEKTPGSSFNLPRSEGISYVHQQSWNLATSVRNNIIFNSEFDQERYDEVLRCCALEADLKLWNAADETQVGEKGITLSGGQKARITLARAIYSSAQTVLIDDCFSALDVQTAKFIVDNCFLGDLVKGRTIVLVTHHLALCTAIQDFIIHVDNGVVVSQEHVERTQPVPIQVLVKELDADDVPELDIAEKLPLVDVPTVAVSSKLIVEEEKALGRVTWPVITLLLGAFGGVWWWIFFATAAILMYSESILTSFLFARWSRAYNEVEDPRDVDVVFYLAIYAGLALVLIINNGLDSYLRLVGVQNVGKSIHERMLDSILSCTLRYLDVTPQGRIIGRFTKDIRLIDRTLPYTTLSLIGRPVSLLMQVVTVLVSVPLLSLPTVLVAIGAGTVAKLYLGAQGSVKREQSNRQTPVFSLYGDALAGLSSIRAYSAADHFRKSTVSAVNSYHRATACFHSLNRWSSARFDLLSACFSLALGFYIVFGARIKDASRVGFLLAISQGLVSSVSWLLRMQADWEIEMNAVERVHDIIHIEHEPAFSTSLAPPAAWPTSGGLEIKSLSARYTPDGPIVLDEISFSVKSGERIGVVGRTGSGKSTLTLALLRLIPTEGEVFFDGRDTKNVNLSDLRSNMTIIPQDPSIQSGTIRANIDPYGSYDDAFLNDVLRSVGLLKGSAFLEVAPVAESSASGASTPKDGALTPNKALSLDSLVTAGGENLSQGTRQLVALARGLCRRSKVYLFDESTASVDHETDALIQRTLNTELQGLTLITIAHRLRTICQYDRILVLADHHIAEFDSPFNLLQKDGGVFKSLVDASSDADELREMAAARQT